MKCSHTKVIERAVVEMDWDMGEQVSRMIDEKVKTIVQVDTHQYKCVQCNEMFNNALGE